MHRVCQFDDRCVTYSADNDNTGAATLNDDILHSPCPVPMDLERCVAVYKYQMASSKLLVT